MGIGGTLKGVLSSLAAIAGFLMTVTGVLGVWYFANSLESSNIASFILGIGIILPISLGLFVGGNLLFIMSAALGGRIFKVLAIPIIIIDSIVALLFGYLTLLAIINGDIPPAIIGAAVTLGLAAIPLFMVKRLLEK